MFPKKLRIHRSSAITESESTDDVAQKTTVAILCDIVVLADELLKYKNSLNCIRKVRIISWKVLDCAAAVSTHSGWDRERYSLWIIYLALHCQTNSQIHFRAEPLSSFVVSKGHYQQPQTHKVKSNRRCEAAHTMAPWPDILYEGQIAHRVLS